MPPKTVRKKRVSKKDAIMEPEDTTNTDPYTSVNNTVHL